MKNILFNGYDIVLFIVIYVCLFFSLFTLTLRRDANPAHPWLSGFFLTQAMGAAYILALYGDAFHAWAVTHTPAIFALFELSLWLEGAALLVYTRVSLYHDVGFTRRDLVLLAPVLIYIITVSSVTLYYPPDQSPAFLRFLQSDYVQYYEHLRNTVRVGFGIWAYLVVQRYQRQIPEAYSNLDLLSYRWLKLLIAGFIVLRLWSAFNVLLFTLINAILGERISLQIDYDMLGIIANYGHLLLISTLLYFGLADSQNVMRITKETLEVVGKATTETRPAYSDEQTERVRKHMITARPYLDSQLKIDDLAQQVSIPPKTLSSLINQQFQMNFFEYINSFRLLEAKRLLRDPQYQAQSIVDLAFRAGYNSKTTFYRLFKIEAGTSPSIYRKQHLLAPQSGRPS
ncbi:MAG: hypothetical protein COA42_21600 [Alteromonadaceae bacterium]|nr:MAG: hypothetical protein COA42_21600 [Alteromonadaceae bacterium]